MVQLAEQMLVPEVRVSSLGGVFVAGEAPGAERSGAQRALLALCALPALPALPALSALLSVLSVLSAAPWRTPRIKFWP